jgi:hypothetical protein
MDTDLAEAYHLCQRCYAPAEGEYCSEACASGDREAMQIQRKEAILSINPYCSLGHNVNHSCRQCLKRSLEAFGIDAVAYDVHALRETAKHRSKDWRKRWYQLGDPGKGHANRKRNYGLEPADYQALLQAQGEVCVLCGQPEIGPAGGNV